MMLPNSPNSWLGFALFISQIDGYDRLSDSFKYMTTLHLAMMDKDRQYKKKFYDPIVAAGEGKVK